MTLHELASDIRYRLRALFQRSAMERELEEEVQFHLARETEKLVRAGVSPMEARRIARVEFGGIENVKAESRDARGLALVDTLRQDLRYAWRGVHAKPGFSLAVIATLALGIGANAAMFSITDRLLFRTPPMLREAERVHRVYLQRPGDQGVDTIRNFQYARFADLTRWSHSFDLTAAFANRTLAIGVGENAREMPVQAVSATYFDFFDTQPLLGRFFAKEEDTAPNGAPVVVLSHALWQERFAGRTNVIGERLQVGDLTLTIIGVAPERFAGVSDGPLPAAFVPITTVAGARNKTYPRTYSWSWLEMLVRRAPGVSVAAANADLAQAYRISWEAQRKISPETGPLEIRGQPASLGPVQLARGPQGGRNASMTKWVAGVTWIVLLVACANVGNLLLARAVRRRREVAVRLALGASRRRLVQQMMTETLLLAVAGGAAALLVAAWIGGVLHAFFFPALSVVSVATDWRTIAFTATCTLAAVLLTGLAPVFDAGRYDVASTLKAGAREGAFQRSRLRSGLLLFQATLSVVLLIGAGLFVRSLQHVRDLRLGYDVEPLLLANGTMRTVKLSPAEMTALSERMLDVARSTPGVRNASLTVAVPFWSNEGRGLVVPGVDSVDKLGRFLLQAASPSYFETTGMRLLRGRTFTDADRDGAPRVAVVTESMARLLWPGRDAIGQQFGIRMDSTPLPTTVVGIVEDMRGRTLTGEPEHWYYLPIAQYGTPEPLLFARASGDPKAVAEPLRRRLQAVMPGSAYASVRPLSDIVDPTMRTWKFGTTMFVGFGALALFVAMIGLYSVFSYAVAQRTHEFGVRIALGGRATDVLGLVLREGVMIAAGGVVIGGLLALWLGRWIEPLLYEQRARDPLVFASVAAVLLVMATVASLVPGLRASSADPLVALRSE